jgi:UDP-N-acetylmuramoyl-tripeptide--D-alanyl-D-alanine ligase
VPSVANLYQLYLNNADIQTDTRKLRKGGIFFALKGDNFDGNKFVAAALDAGVAFAVTTDHQWTNHPQCIVVDDTLTALQQLALEHRRHFTVPFIAITGSNGKTTTKELITAALRAKYITYATDGNLNNHIGVPLTILKIKADAAFAIIEMGANHQQEIASYCRIALPTHGIITNCGKAHIEGFGGVEGVRKGKGELYDYLRSNNGTIFRNTDLEYLEAMADGINSQITYGRTNADYIGKPMMNGVFLDVAMLTKHSETTIATHLVGEYNFANVMVAVAVGRTFDIGIDAIKEAIAAYNPDNSRSQWLQKGSNQVILDAYNANPTSMAAAITNFAQTNLPTKLLWIGGMKEMGADEHKEHTELVALIGNYKWDGVILVGNEFKDIPHNNQWYATSAAAAEAVKQNPPVGSAILIKGSRGSKMEVLLSALPE